MNRAMVTLAGVGLGLLCSSARAEIVYTDIPDQVFTTGTASSPGGKSVNIDLDANGVVDFAIYESWMARRMDMPPFDIRDYFSLVRIGSSWPNTVNGFDARVAYEDPVAKCMTAGQVVGPELLSFVYGIGDNAVVIAGMDPIVGGGGLFGDGYLGLKFQIAGTTHYGWAGFHNGNTLTDVAYETTADTPIAAGAVPEPASLGLIAIVPLLLTRRSRRV